MSRNGSGTYTLPAGNPVVSGTVISSTVQNNTMTDIANALTNSIAANGETPVTANLPMNGHKLSGLSAGTVAGDSLRYEQAIGVFAPIASPTFTGTAAAPTASYGDASTKIATTEFGTENYAPLAGAVVLTDATSSRNILATDKGKYLRFTSASATTVNFRPDGTEALLDNSEFNIRAAGSGGVTLVAGVGVTLNTPSGGTLVLTQGMTVTVKRVALNVFDVMGQTVPA